MRKMILLTVLICIILTIGLHPLFALTDEEASVYAQQAYEKALDAAKNQDVELASMYFINALSFKPGDIDIISNYVSLILKRAKAETEISAETLNALDNFLNAQIMTVKPDGIKKIIDLRGKVSDTREKILQSMTEAKETNVDLKDIESELKKNKAAVSKSKTLKEYISALQAAQKTIDSYGIADMEITNNLQAAVMLDAAIHQINELISGSRSEEFEPLKTYYLQLAENSMQQVIGLSAVIPSEIRKEVLSVKTSIEARIQEFSEERSAAVLKEIKDSYKKLEINGSTQQKKIKQLNDFIQSVTIRAQAITSEKYGSELRDMIYEIQEQILKYRNDQEKAYNRWALNQMDTMMVEANKHDRTLYKAKLRDEDAMCNTMIKYLSSIDTRLLNFGAQHCFSRVYEEYYQKLDSVNQKKLDEAMAYKKKRELTEF